VYQDRTKCESQSVREGLWHRRLAIEARLVRRRPTDAEDSSYRNSPKIVFFRGLLRVLGLFNRGVRNANRPVLRSHAFSFAHLPDALDGFRILLVSDFHFDDRPGFLTMIEGLVKGVECDLCLFAGDFRFNLSAPVRYAYEGVERLLSILKPKHGIVAVLGNNDSSHLVEGLHELGVRVLVNESCEVTVGGSSLWLAGVDDPHDFRCHGLVQALQGIPPGVFTILLAHSPEIIAEAADAGVDLYLCGHTHAGQVCLPGLGALHLNTRCSRKYMGGPWRWGQLEGYTTAGIGTSTVPVRYNCPPEAVVIELRRAGRG